MPVISPVKMNVPHNVSVSALVLPRLLEHGDRVAMVEDDTGRHMTYNEFVLNVKRLGAALLKQDLKPGQVVTICAPNCMEHVVLYHALARIGCTYHGINAAFPDDDISYQVNHSDTRILVTDTSTLTKINHIIHQCPTVKNIFLVGEEAVQDVATLQSLMTDDECDDISDIDTNFDARETPFTLVYTSGTTGIPKGVLRSQYTYSCSTWQVGHDDYLIAQPGDVSVVMLPFFHGVAQAVIMIHHMCVATKLILMPNGRDFPNYLRTIEKYKANTLWTNPTIVIKLATKNLTSGYELSSVRAIVYAGAPIRTPLVNRLMKELTGIQLIAQVYGMSECACLTMPILNKNKPDSCGILAPGGEMKVLDLQTGQELGPNTKGEIYFRSPTLMLGYLKDPEKTARAIDPEGWLRTGDVGYYDDDCCLFVGDRVKDLIKYKTLKIFPSDLDTALLSHPGVVDVATISVQRPCVGEIPYCFVVTKKSTDLTEFELRQVLSERVQSPVGLIGDLEMEIVPEIPRNPPGKVLLQQLQQWAGDKTILRVAFTDLTLRTT